MTEASVEGTEPVTQGGVTDPGAQPDTGGRTDKGDQDERTGTELLLPAGARLVHVGPHKTGTTTVQDAFHSSRARLAEHGVLYAGKTRQPTSAVLAVVGRPPLRGAPKPDIERWRALCEEVTGAGDRRVLISSERLAHADPETAARIVTDLGGDSDNVHVVVTLRPLTSLLPSQWQQYASEDVSTGYREWLEAMLEKPPYERPTPSFWIRHRHDRLIERWVAAVGAERVTAIVVDQTDPGGLVHTFEAMLGLPNGILVGEGLVNRSLTMGEIELAKQLRKEFKQAELPGDLYYNVIFEGALPRLRHEHRPLPFEPRIQTPAWALKRAAEIGTEMAGNIAASGVRVVGDLEDLGRMPDVAEDDPPEPEPVLSPAAAAQAVVGAVLAAQRAVPKVEAEPTDGRPAVADTEGPSTGPAPDGAASSGESDRPPTTGAARSGPGGSGRIGRSGPPVDGQADRIEALPLTKRPVGKVKSSDLLLLLATRVGRRLRRIVRR